MNDRMDTTALTEGASTDTNTDPCLAFVNGWNAALKESESIAKVTGSDEIVQKHWKAHVVPFAKQAERNKVPAATTAEGAAAALQRVLDWDDMEDQDAGLIRAALAFLRGPAGGVQPDPLAEALKVYQAQVDEFEGRPDLSDDEFDAIKDATWGGFESAVGAGETILPDATTGPGAALALRIALHDEDLADFQNVLIEKVAAFLEGRAAR